MTGLMDELLGKNAALKAKERREVKRGEQIKIKTRTSDEIRVRLTKFLSQSPMLYEVLCVANDLDAKNKDQNLTELTKLAEIYLFKGSERMGFGEAENEPRNFSYRNLLTDDGGDFWVAEYLLWDEVEIYLMPYEDKRKSFVCRVMEKDEVYEEPVASGHIYRNLDVLCDGDLKRNTALGLIDNYSGIFSKELSRWHLSDGDFLNTQKYTQKIREKAESDRKSAELDRYFEEKEDEDRKRIERAIDEDPEGAWVYAKEKEDRDNGRGRWFVP